MTDSSDWKRKYLDQLDEVETLERRHRDERHRLERLLVRASLAAEGQDRALDEVLAAVREQIQGDTPSVSALDDLQQQLDELLSRFDDRRAEADQSLQDAIRLLVSQLRERAPAELRGDLRALEKRIQSTMPDLIHLPGVLHELARMQHSVITHGEPLARTEGFWRRLFGRERAVVPADPDRYDSAESEVANTDLDASTEDEEVTELGVRIERLLRHLIQQVPLSDEVRELAESLQRRARGWLTLTDIPELLDEVTGLVGLVFGRGRLEFEQFLGTLDERLKRIREDFQEDLLDSAAWQDQAAAFDRDMDDQLQSITEVTRDATELRDLKQSISRQIERLGDTVGQYRSAEKQREEKLADQVTRLRDKVTVMESQAEQMQVQLQQERERASTDLLTQLPNREGLEERLGHEYARWERYGQPVSLAILDIDRFKDLNDTYGHLAGDKVLQLVARALRENLRRPDFVARYGGEEFVVLLPETDGKQALQVMDKARDHVAGLPFHFRQQKVRVTFSAGVTEFRTVSDVSEILDAADRALYQAKSEGRDRVCQAQESHWRPHGDEPFKE